MGLEVSVHGPLTPLLRVWDKPENYGGEHVEEQNCSLHVSWETKERRMGQE
jgi:hypothetical protein